MRRLRPFFTFMAGYLLAALLFVGVTVTSAQDEPAEPSPAAETVEVEANGLTYTLDGTQPLVLYVDQTIVNQEGAFIAPLIWLREANGEFVQLAPCDRIVIPCRALYTRATAGLAGAEQGSSFVLDEDG